MVPSRLVLFDIDGTILSADRGLWENPFGEAMERAYAEAGKPRRISTDQYRMGGKTDTQIIYEILGQNGLAEADIAPMVAPIRETYMKMLAEKVRERPDYIRLKPGVVELLEDLQGRPEALLGLLTGNFEEGARIKLSAHGLNRYFAFGAYGENARQRSQLPQRALDAAEAKYGHKFSRKQIVIIGDTPNDIHCGRHLHVRTLAMATGPFSLEELRAEKPDFAFPDFTDRAGVLSAILDPLAH